MLEVQTRLRDHGEDGLAEQLDEAVASLPLAERDREQYQSRAAARKLLFEICAPSVRRLGGPMWPHSDNASTTLGASCSCSGFSVEFDDNLRIVTITPRHCCPTAACL